VLEPGTRVCPRCGALQVGRPAASLTKGETLDRGYGRLVVDERVGEGGMGVVYRAWLFHAPKGPRGGQPPELVALKVLRPHLDANPEVRRLFLNEADTLRRLSHPNIVRFYDLFAHDGLRVLAMEYVDGAPLSDVIARNSARARLAGQGLPGLPFRRAWAYMEQLLGALAAIHALGILHRDVKPSNLVIRRDGVAKLTDFGIARLAPTGTTGILAPGTGAYMAPEQVLGEPLDGRSDLYAAATVLYECLAGRTPFGAEDEPEIVLRQRQVNETPPPLQTWVPQAPAVLDALFRRALAKDREARFADAVELGEAFRIALGIPESVYWRALVDLARAAATTPFAEVGVSARLATLRDVVVARSATLKMTIP
jgi:serine/threonine-protein kinase